MFCVGVVKTHMLTTDFDLDALSSDDVTA